MMQVGCWMVVEGYYVESKGQGEQWAVGSGVSGVFKLEGRRKETSYTKAKEDKPEGLTAGEQREEARLYNFSQRRSKNLLK